MDKAYYVPIMGAVPSLTTSLLEIPEHPADLLVNSYAYYRRYAVQIDDDGLEMFGIHHGDYLLFREQRWPTQEGQICLITLGDEVTIRMLEYIYNPSVILRVGEDLISPLELAPTDFRVIGVFDGIVKTSLATLVNAEDPYDDWGCAFLNKRAGIYKKNMEYSGVQYLSTAVRGSFVAPY